MRVSKRWLKRIRTTTSIESCFGITTFYFLYSEFHHCHQWNFHKVYFVVSKVVSVLQSRSRAGKVPDACCWSGEPKMKKVMHVFLWMYSAVVVQWYEDDVDDIMINQHNNYLTSELKCWCWSGCPTVKERCTPDDAWWNFWLCTPSMWLNLMHTRKDPPCWFFFIPSWWIS